MATENPGSPTAGGNSPIYVTLVTMDSVTSRSFTQREAKEQGLLDQPGFQLLDPPEVTPRRHRGPECSTCGFSQHDFEKYGRFGCPDCYEQFGNLLPPILGRMHKGGRHVGKVPKNALSGDVLRNRMQYLRQEMQNAIRTERFEEAALLRDQLRELQEISREEGTGVPSEDSG